MQEVTLKLTLEETNLVLEGLGNLPFAKVYALVAKVQNQAGEQIKSHAPSDEPPPSPAAPK